MMRALFLFLCLTCFCTATFADASDDMHKQSAFLFAKRKDWKQAIEHAKLAHSEVLTKYFTWEYLKDPQSDASFDDITAFMEQNTNWPDNGALEKRAEVALMAANPSDSVLSDWFSKHPPQTIFVKSRMTKDTEALHAMIRSAWVTDNYDKETEMKILAQYHSILLSTDHIRRVDRLLWEGNYDDAKRLLPFVPTEYQNLFQARMALAEDKFYAPASLLRVSGSLKNDPGLTYERIRWRVRSDDKDGVRELLMITPNEVPYPEKWWPMRDRQIHEALAEGSTAVAEKLLARHAQKPGSIPYKEAMWLQGWIALEFRKSPDAAYKTFVKLFNQSETPVGKARAAYWAGRAEQAIAKSDPSQWFENAAQYSTTFYGQLAAWELNKDDKDWRGHTITSAPQPTRAEEAAFKKRELVQLIYELASADETDAAGRFIMYLVQNAKTDSESILATGLGRQIARIDFSVRAAKKALQNNIVILENGWPVINTATDGDVEQSFILALSRQESEFYANAVSGSGAIGIMQLLPATAKETAKKNGLAYSNDMLYEPGYNMKLGSIYMKKLLDKFDGSYVLGAASYNAGPYRVLQWMNIFGQPSKDVHHTLDWIEIIPTPETRNYVEHVLENMEVYRFLLAGRQASGVTIADDLTRSK